jgi:phage terminase small subunit
MALSAKQKAFINEYLTDFNATRAAQRAGYGGDENTLAVTGSRLLRIDKVDEAIQIRLQERVMSANEVLDRLAEQARADYKDFLNVAPNGDIALDMAKAEGKTHLIRRVTQKRTVRRLKDAEIDETSLTLELHDAQAALVQLGKHHKLFVDKVDVNHSGKIEHSNVTELTDEQLADIASRRSGGTALTQGRAA